MSFAKGSRCPGRRAAVVRAATWTLAGLVLSGAIALALFVVPHWSDYRFYNWQMSVTRKPEYSVRALLDRASWLPIVHDYFTRMWLMMAVGALGLVSIAARWRTARPSERLLALWVLVGFIELVVHDSGNERRYVMFIPAFIALASLVIGGRGRVLPSTVALDRSARWLAAPLLLFLCYLVFGSLIRLAFLGEIGPPVRLSAALAVVAGALVVWQWRALCDWLSRQQITATAAIAVDRDHRRGRSDAVLAMGAAADFVEL